MFAFCLANSAMTTWEWLYFSAYSVFIAYISSQYCLSFRSANPPFPFWSKPTSGGGPTWIFDMVTSLTIGFRWPWAIRGSIMCQSESDVMLVSSWRGSDWNASKRSISQVVERYLLVVIVRIAQMSCSSMGLTWLKGVGSFLQDEPRRCQAGAAPERHEKVPEHSAEPLRHRRAASGNPRLAPHSRSRQQMEDAVDEKGSKYLLLTQPRKRSKKRLCITSQRRLHARRRTSMTLPHTRL